MSESTTATVADKVADKIAGLLERLVDARMLILGMSFLMYLDIWLIDAGLDPYTMTFDDGLGRMKLLSIGHVAMFVVSYSLLMSATVPAIRMLYLAVMVYFGPERPTSRNQSVEDRQLSSWSLGFVAFTVWDAWMGYFQHGKYRGVVEFLFERLSGDGFTVGVFRVSSVIFFLVCLALAFERDS